MMAAGEEQNSVKPEKFSGQNFRRWQQQMRYWLTTLGLVSVLSSDDASQASESGIAESSNARADKDYLCHGRILSALSDSLYDIYSKTKTAKELWNALETKYGKEDEGLDNYIVGKYLDFKMVDEKSVVHQVQELQNLVHELTQRNINVDEKFHVHAVIEKLPPKWSSFAVSLRHKRGSMTLDNLIVSLRIEERKREKDRLSREVSNDVNIVQGKTNNYKKTFSANKSNKNLKPTSKNNNSKGGCWVCEKPGHVARHCFLRKDKVKSMAEAPVHQANMVTIGTSNGTVERFVTIKPEICLVSDSIDWWIDTGANIHVCADKSLFWIYQVTNGKSVSMGNGAVAHVLGEGTMNLLLSSERTLKLTNVQHVPEIRKNLISG